MENKNISDEERLALAAKLDDDLDAFINSLEKKRYTEGWPADRWEQVRKLISSNGETFDNMWGTSRFAFVNRQRDFLFKF